MQEENQEINKNPTFFEKTWQGYFKALFKGSCLRIWYNNFLYYYLASVLIIIFLTFFGFLFLLMGSGSGFINNEKILSFSVYYQFLNHFIVFLFLSFSLVFLVGIIVAVPFACGGIIELINIIQNSFFFESKKGKELVKILLKKGKDNFLIAFKFYLFFLIILILYIISFKFYSNKEQQINSFSFFFFQLIQFLLWNLFFIFYGLLLVRGILRKNKNIFEAIKIMGKLIKNNLKDFSKLFVVLVGWFFLVSFVIGAMMSIYEKAFLDKGNLNPLLLFVSSIFFLGLFFLIFSFGLVVFFDFLVWWLTQFLGIKAKEDQKSKEEVLLLMPELNQSKKPEPTLIREN